MKKCNVYTRTGDDGKTCLVGGQRVAKSCLRLETYGTVDELNSQLGLLMTYIEQADLRERLLQSQRDLFTIGSILATPADTTSSCQLTDADVSALEQAIDATADGLPGWRVFTVPGGCRAAAVAHVCRTVCRRMERAVCLLDEQEPVNQVVKTYINRLSDYLYIVACRLNHLAGTEEELWHSKLSQTNK